LRQPASKRASKQRKVVEKEKFCRSYFISLLSEKNVRRKREAVGKKVVESNKYPVSISAAAAAATAIASPPPSCFFFCLQTQSLKKFVSSLSLDIFFPSSKQASAAAKAL